MGELRDLDLRYVWHPFTQMKEFVPDEDLIIVRARGNYLFDEEGDSFFDATSSLWVNVHGHCHPALNASVRHQLGRVAHSTLLGIGNEPAARLAQRLCTMAPGSMTRVFYSDNGSTAVEVALKMAFQYFRHQGATGRQRSRFVSLTNGYHGDTLGSVSVGGMELFHSIFSPLLFQTHLAPSPNCYRCPFDSSHPGCGLKCVEALDDLLTRHEEEIAAVVVEPLVQGAGGIVVYPPEVLRGYHQAARDHGVLFVVDEVATGFGRTGTLFACEQAGVVPDMVALAKGLTGGYLPVAATLVNDKVYRGFLDDYARNRTFFHGHTFTGNPLGCAAALASLDELEQGGVLARVGQTGAHLGRRLSGLEGHPFIGNVRSLGLMGGIELVRDPRQRLSFPPADRIGHRVCLEARKAGVLARPLGDVLVLMPPLSSTTDEIDAMLDALLYGIDSVLSRAARKPPRLPPAVDDRFGVVRESAFCRRAPAANRLLVTGTDTGVGKTVVAACLATALRATGRPVRCYKPVESGVCDEPQPGERSDAELLALAAGPPPGLPRYTFPEPLSPNVAARLAGAPTDFAAIVRGLRDYAGEGCLLVEGAGGLLVPITDGLTCADLAREADLALLLVVGDKLGCINHTLLTVRAVNDLGLSLAGVVLHPVRPRPADPSAEFNRGELARLLGKSFLGEVPFVEDPADSEQRAAAGLETAGVLWPS